MDIVQFEKEQQRLYHEHRADKMIPNRFKAQTFRQFLLVGYLEALTEIQAMKLTETQEAVRQTLRDMGIID